MKTNNHILEYASLIAKVKAKEAKERAKVRVIKANVILARLGLPLLKK